MVAKSAQFRFSFPPGYLTMRMSSVQPDQTGKENSDEQIFLKIMSCFYVKG